MFKDSQTVTCKIQKKHVALVLPDWVAVIAVFKSSCAVCNMDIVRNTLSRALSSAFSSLEEVVPPY